MVKRWAFVLFLIIISINLISAINLDVSSKQIQNSIITDLEEPAIFELTIRNLEETEDFEIYSLVGVDITPNKVNIESGKSKTLEIEVMPQKSILSEKRIFTFEYKIKNSANEIQIEKLSINIIGLEDTISIKPDNINPNSKIITILMKNKLNYDFQNTKLSFQSAFFNYNQDISIKPNEEIELDIPLDLEKLKSSVAGNYLLNTNIEFKQENANIESIIKFLEQEGIETNENKEGVLIKRQEIIKNNVGNVIKQVEIVSQRNILSYLFTTFNIVPTETTRQGFNINYIWKKEIVPNEELKVVIKTNWFYPILIILFAIALFVLIRKSVERDLELRKRVSFVKTKGGEFALKVTVKAKAKKFIERINIIDKLPPLVELYGRYGAISPDKVDLKNRRLEWNITSLNEKEERIFSYIIYSKIGIVGRFELPKARAVYEKQGKLKETESNRSFFINQPKG
tara:strand:- start:2001 stop:3371 length:1371 start_codon:yes stop_codon:yes gene_type:complete